MPVIGSWRSLVVSMPILYGKFKAVPLNSFFLFCRLLTAAYLWQTRNVYLLAMNWSHKKKLKAI